VTVVSGKTRAHLALLAFGRGSALGRVGSVSPEVLANHVAYAHAGVREWYANGPLGLEQGFYVARAPARGHGPLTLSLALSGDFRARLEHSGVLLKGPGAALRYGGLSVSDARGRALDSWLELRPGRLLIRVDDRRAVYPLKVDPLLQQAELTASDGRTEDGLGFAVAVSGNTIVAGAPLHEVGVNEEQGAAYVFTMPASGWANATQTAELTASDGGVEDGLGSAVAVSGNTIVAGAFRHKVGPNIRQGAAYVFTMPASGWANATQTAELTASDGGTEDHLGSAVAVAGNTIVAGAHGANARQGAAYVFTMPASGWANATQSAELTTSDGGAFDGLGSAVAVSGNTIVAGAPSHAAGINEDQGAGYVFTMPATGWANATQTAELTASDGAAEDGLGSAIAVSGNTIVAGAPNHKVGANGEQGAAYAFANPSGSASGSPSGSPGGPLSLAHSPVLPRLSSAHQSHSIWREGSKLAHISAKKKPPVGTTFSFSLNEPAAISFSFTQTVRRKCVPHTKKNRRRPACRHSVTAGTLSFIGHSGTNKVDFQGRISGSKKLKPGRYTLVIIASNSIGYSKPLSLTFTIVK
jgi:hypothetical protein